MNGVGRWGWRRRRRGRWRGRCWMEEKREGRKSVARGGDGREGDLGDPFFVGGGCEGRKEALSRR